MEPVKPEHLDPFAAAFLTELQREPAANAFVLGGYFALKHYLDYRETADVDAWWRSREDPAALDAARRAFATAAQAAGYEVRERRWGETLSLEALDGTRKVFSFQVAVRSVELDAPVRSPWGAVAIETLDDNIASKMQALVARGAPRDFVDIKAVVDAGLISVDRCWELFAAKRSGMTVDDARLRVLANLMRIEARLPLNRVPDERRRAAAAFTKLVPRTFFGERRDVIDQSVYPDGAHAETFVDDADRADYVHRICAAFDFGIAPERDTVALFRSWRDVFERFPILDSPGYHALRAHFRWSRMPVAMHPLAAPWEVLDAREERDDPCRDLV